MYLTRERIMIRKIVFTILCVTYLFGLKAEPSFNPKVLGKFAISVDLFLYIMENIEQGKTILELGSGSGTGQLAKYYTMYSIEHDRKWVNKYPSHYIYAPIKEYDTYQWYNTDLLKSNLPAKYDLIIIDGPTGKIGREGFIYNLGLFNTDVMLIIDDVDRPAELQILKDVSKKLGRSYTIYECSDGKSFGVIEVD